MAYELQEEEKRLLDFEFFKPTFETGSLGNGATEIMTKPVTNAQFCIYLNYAFMDKKIEIDGNGKVVDSESKDLLMDLDNSDIYLEDGKFIVNEDKYENRVTGITYVIAEMFILWLSKLHKVNYKISEFWGNYSDRDGVFDIDSFKSYPLSYEFYYFTYQQKFKICPNLTTGNFHLNQGTIKNDYTSKETSFRMMKLPAEAK